MNTRRHAASPPEQLTRLVACASFIVLILSAPVTVSAAPWYEHYALAENALSKEDWNGAIAQLNEAIQRRGDSGAHIRSYGMKVISYFPYLKLGIAYHNLGQHEAAIRAFETEERLGAVNESPEDFQILQSFRSRSQAAQAAEADRLAGERTRIATEGLQRARRLEDAGSIDEALGEVQRVLSVMPDNIEANEALTRLRAESARLAREKEAGTRVNALVRDGRGALAAGDFEFAASLLDQAMNTIDATPGLARPKDLDDLLARAREGLRAELAGANETHSAVVDSILLEVTRLESEGNIDDALRRLQRAIAIDPEDQGALEAQKRLLSRREAQADATTLAGLVSEMEQSFQKGRYEESLGAANRILAFDSSHPSALEYVRRAWVELGRRLLGEGATGNLPPAIRFADFREQAEDGTLVQTVHDAEFHLSGISIDNAEPTLSFYDQNDEPLVGNVRTNLIGEYHIAEFNVSLTLEPGVTRIRVAAVDPEGLASSSEYAVAFEPSLTNTVWFRGAIAAVLLAILASVLLVRRLRKLRLRKRRYNPYIAGAPVLSEELFFGREPLVRRILQTIHNNSLLLHGERRIGKTSLQHHLRKRLVSLDDPAYQFLPVFIDLQGVPEERFFATLIDEIEEQLAEQLETIELPSVASGRENYGYREFVAELRTVLATLRARTSKQVKLVLLIDEVDELNDYDPRVNQRLRSLFMKSFAENLVAIVSGVQIKKKWEREASPWYNFFEEIEVAPFGPADVEALVRTPIDGVLGIEDGLIDRIVAVTGGKPYLVQRLCIALVNHVYDEGRRVITLADVDAVGAPEVS